MTVWPWYWPKEGMPHKTEPFTWIKPGIMAASWWPDKKLFERFRKERIKVIINVSEFNNAADIPMGFAFHHFDIPDYGIPGERQLDEFLEITRAHGEKKEPVVVHCVAGCGRTGVMLAIWGFTLQEIPGNQNPVKWIRSIRECTLETNEQQSFVLTQCKRLDKKRVKW